MCRLRSGRRGRRGFTLIELLVVVAIIALLISILLPSLRDAKKQAQAAVCGSNLRQIMFALRTYQDEHQGWLPTNWDPSFHDTGSIWSEAGWWIAKRYLWFYNLVPRYLGDPNALRCPGDPFFSRYDFEANTALGPHTNAKVPSCGYGLNYILRHWQSENQAQHLCKTDTYPPQRPAQTILLAEVGPDDQLGLYNCNTIGPAQPWRDGGRLIWDDGLRDWYTGPTWLTARHLGRINMSAFDGSVKRVRTLDVLRVPIKKRYRECWGGSQNSSTYVCMLCEVSVAHYSFWRDQMWWWTGPVPQY